MTIVRQDYEAIFKPHLVKLAQQVEVNLCEVFDGWPRIDRIQARAKSPERFLAKASKKNDDGTPKYTNPLLEIQDQVGARIITFYLSDVRNISAELERHFSFIEMQDVLPDSVSEFGYESKHYIVNTPTDLLPPDVEASLPKQFELQVKTLFQHAWAETSHDIAYKELSGSLDKESKRLVALSAAQSWGSDNILEDILRKLSNPEQP